MPKLATRRMVAVSVVILLLVGAANAYTVIMLGGRRLEIPSSFVVTPATLTCEISDGIQITVPMAAIDIAATEKANHERPGSLLARAKMSTMRASDQSGEEEQARSGSRRTITNRDLEELKRRRQDSEAAYEIKRKHLGLPSMDEQRKLAAASFDSVTMELAQQQITKLESERIWRARATELRTEMATLDAELNYIRNQLVEGPFATRFGVLTGSLTSAGSVIEFRNSTGNGNFAWRPLGKIGGGRWGQRAHGPNIYVSPSSGTQVRAQVGLRGGSSHGQVFVGADNFRQSRQIGVNTSLGVLPNTVFGSPVQGYDFTYERSALITRFNELAAARAGLNARWRELEDEARRAGVSPGWLRP
jgi:hypothetical protein